VNCWDTFTFNTSTCTWDNDGTAHNLQQPEKVNWDTLLSTILLVIGIMMEPHNLQHQKSKLLGYFTFNTSTCTWDNDGTKPAAPEKANCWDTLLSTPLLVLGIMMELHNLQHQKKVNCWDTFTFNNSTCTWDNDGTVKPTPANKVNCWDYFQQFNLYLG
jgi:hypothetical protein